MNQQKPNSNLKDFENHTQKHWQFHNKRVALIDCILGQVI